MTDSTTQIAKDAVCFIPLVHAPSPQAAQGRLGGEVKKMNPMKDEQLKLIQRQRTVCKIIILMFFLIPSWGYSQCRFGKSYIDSMMKRCEEFTRNYKPVYVVDGDSLAVSRIPNPPDDINIFLGCCIKNRNYEPLKFFYVILIKQYEIHVEENGGMDYTLETIAEHDNGFMRLTWYFLKLNKASNLVLRENLFEDQVAGMLKKRKKMIPNFSDVDSMLQ